MRRYADRNLPEVERATRLGTVRGVERAGAHSFWGLRYAQPTRRYEPPEPATAWHGVYDATRHRPMAPQAPFLNVLGDPPEGGMSEDCLHLNVHLPATAPAAPRPVLFFIHGGALTGGAANQYDGSALAVGADAVVVCANYRLGVFGGLDLDRFGPPYEGSGELWLRDQIMALHWVRDNIADYGGDPGCVTVMGESAGATSALALCASPAAAGLFHRAMSNSGGSPATEPPAVDRVAEIARIKKIGPEDVLDFLLSAPTGELLQMSMDNMRLAPSAVCGTALLPGPVPALIRDRGAGAVPLVAGFAAHEGDSLDFLIGEAGLRGPMGFLARHLIARAVAATNAGGRSGLRGYLRRLRGTHRAWVGARFNDLVWTDLYRRGAVENALATTGAGSRGYVYVLDVPCRIGERRMRSTHGVDLSLTFNPWADPDAEGGGLADHPDAPALANRWVAMLARFARTGDPSGPLGDWPVYDARTRPTLVIAPGESRIEYDLDPEYRTSVWPVPGAAPV
ncbi:carboxylesterase family protein [Streptosporangium sp. NPDC002607]